MNGISPKNPTNLKIGQKRDAINFIMFMIHLGGVI